jgi:ferrochelatase
MPADHVGSPGGPPAPAAPPIGLLVMAYGTATGPEDIERYYTDIRGGRPPPPDLLEDLKARYAAIGNRFPLLEITSRQAEALERELNGAGGSFRAYLGMKHSRPFISDAVNRMREDGIERAVGLVMAPHWSGMSVETYVERVEKAVADGGGGPAFRFIRTWYHHPGFIRFLAQEVRSALDRLTTAEREWPIVVFSAHSLPVRPATDGRTFCLGCSLCDEACRYEAQLRDTARRVAAEAGLNEHAVAWQSAGHTPDVWWGPSVEQVIREAAGAGRTAVVVCSAGFVADHLEILGDLDLDARSVAREAGIGFVRTEMPNARPDFVAVLADIVRIRLGEDGNDRA